jgi:hypothetical protein
MTQIAIGSIVLVALYTSAARSAPINVESTERQLTGHRLCLPSGTAHFGRRGRYIMITKLGKRVVGAWSASGSLVSVIFRDGRATNYSIATDGRKVDISYDFGGKESGRFCD